jgi:MFS transporter, CP family, cyanate transporter
LKTCANNLRAPQAHRRAASRDMSRRDLAIGRHLVPLTLLWLAGASLRLTVLDVPPVLPLIHADLGLSEAAVGALGSLPSLVFAFAAVPGSLLIARLGARPTLVAGLLVTALAAAARGAAGDVALLYLATLLMSAGIAIMQPALPPLVRNWVPEGIGFATAVYTNGLLVGETLAVALTIPLVLPLVAGSWRWSFAVWAIPVLATAVLVVALAPRGDGGAARDGRRWWPDWRDPLAWRLSFMLGGVNTIYFGTNTFLPDYLTSLGRADLIGSALTSLNICQLPASLLMLALAQTLARRVWPFIALGALVLASVLGILATPGGAIVAWSGVIGFANAAMLVLMLALPPLLSAPDDVHRMSAAMFTISYPCALVIPILAGIAWDATGVPAVSIGAVGLCAIAIIALAATTDLAARR